MRSQLQSQSQYIYINNITKSSSRSSEARGSAWPRGSISQDRTSHYRDIASFVPPIPICHRNLLRCDAAPSHIVYRTSQESQVAFFVVPSLRHIANRNLADYDVDPTRPSRHVQSFMFCKVFLCNFYYLFALGFVPPRYIKSEKALWGNKMNVLLL